MKNPLAQRSIFFGLFFIIFALAMTLQFQSSGISPVESLAAKNHLLGVIVDSYRSFRFWLATSLAFGFSFEVAAVMSHELKNRF